MKATFKVAVSEEKQAEQYAKPLPPGDGSTTEKTLVEPPFTSYQNENKMPYTAKYLGIETIWNDREMEDDVQEIEDYVRDLVNKGELKDEVDAVKYKLKKIEKMANIDQLEGRGNRLIKLSAFIKYLKHLEGRMKNEQYI